MLVTQLKNHKSNKFMFKMLGNSVNNFNLFQIFTYLLKRENYYFMKIMAQVMTAKSDIFAKDILQLFILSLPHFHRNDGEKFNLKK